MCWRLLLLLLIQPLQLLLLSLMIPRENRRSQVVLRLGVVAPSLSLRWRLILLAVLSGVVTLRYWNQTRILRMVFLLPIAMVGITRLSRRLVIELPGLRVAAVVVAHRSVRNGRGFEVEGGGMKLKLNCFSGSYSKL